ncbi:unnamed protein product [Protopolystoma xenopodis]|uniref:Uncharacterized protein n=1 Tax=Protopolystoma xenopodis TaxID=117903 RepID=A0A448XFZ2_9PLAT|nr:unnamed protein product [Protopolystoma xenopodis]
MPLDDRSHFIYLARIQLFSVVCPKDTVYDYRLSRCASENTDSGYACPLDPPATGFSTFTRGCASDIPGNCFGIPLRALKLDMTFTLENLKVEEVYKYTPASIGWNYFTPDNNWRVKPGYRLGFIASHISTLSYIVVTEDYPIDLIAFKIKSVVKGQEIAQSSFMKMTKRQHQIGAYIRPEVSMRLTGKLSNIGTQSVSITLRAYSKNFSTHNFTSSSSINIVQGSTDCELVTKVAAAGNPTQLKLTNHGGKQAKLSLHFCACK